MSWLRDTLKALVWAVGAAALAIAVAYSGVSHGLTAPAVTLAFGPAAAYRFHRSPRVAWLTLGWLALLIAAAAGFLWWELRDFHFRAIQG